MKFQFPQKNIMKKIALYGTSTIALGAGLGISYFGYFAQVPAAAFTAAQTHAAATFGNATVGTYAAISSFTVNQVAIASGYGAAFAATCLGVFKAINSGIESRISRRVREVGAPDLAEIAAKVKAEHRKVQLANEEIARMAARVQARELAIQQPVQELTQLQRVRELAALESEKVTLELQKRALELSQQQLEFAISPPPAKKTIQEQFAAFLIQEEPKAVEVASKAYPHQELPSELVQQEAFEELEARLAREEAAAAVEQEQSAYTPSMAVRSNSPKKCRALNGLNRDNILSSDIKRNRNKA
jgi:hypothetical protein